MALALERNTFSRLWTWMSEDRNITCENKVRKLNALRFCKQCMHDLQFMKTWSSSPNLYKLARADISYQFMKTRSLCRHCIQKEWTLALFLWRLDTLKYLQFETFSGNTSSSEEFDVTSKATEWGKKLILIQLFMLHFAVAIGLFKYLKLTFKVKPSYIFECSLVEKGPRRH